MSQDGASGLSPEEVETVEAVAAIHNDHHDETGYIQQLIDRATLTLGRPWAVIVLFALVGGWLAAAAWAGPEALDAAMVWIEFLATLAALFVAMMILVTQRRETELAERRAQLTLELSLLSDRKNAKIVGLLEELRRDAPEIADRYDAESEAMAVPADLNSVADAIDDSHR